MPDNHSYLTPALEGAPAHQNFSDWIDSYLSLCLEAEKLACQYFGLSKSKNKESKNKERRFFTRQPLEYLYDRSEILGFESQGSISSISPISSISMGGSCRMLQCQDGVIALNLARKSDFELLPAWLGANIQAGNLPANQTDNQENTWEDTWRELKEICLERKARPLVDLGAELGLALALVERKALSAYKFINPYKFIKMGSWRSGAPPINVLDVINVLDLSSLWAGPLTAKILAEAGVAQVRKIESQHRPDGTRATPDFYEYLNGSKILETLDFKSAAGITRLKSAISKADVVIESSRPRALRHLGIIAEDCAREHNLIWVSITGYGRESNRIAYGDDAAVAGGLYEIYDGALPYFIGDAIADPITAMAALLGIVRCLGEGASGILDVGMVPAVKFLGNSSS